jgi:short subunit dehydrogenase-like uncharacterized protein
MIYGAYGYTGQLIAEEAVRRGHRPLLAGRSAEKLAPVAQRLGLPFRAVSLDDHAELARSLQGLALVLHCAGPFVHTSAPMLGACLAASVSYLDLTGELRVFEATLAQDEAAKQRGIAIIPGVAFDIVPSDCLARYVAERVPGAVELEIAFCAELQPSAGTASSALGAMMHGGFVRRDGQLQPSPIAAITRRVRFSDSEQVVASIPMGDLVAGHATTGIPNITCYYAVPPWFAREIAPGRPLGAMLMASARALLAMPGITRVVHKAIGTLASGPDRAARERGRSCFWARAVDAGGHAVEAWLDCPEPYRFTELVTVRCVERVLRDRPRGALPPALAFGADFVLEIEGTRRRG